MQYFVTSITLETLKAEYDLWKRKWMIDEYAVGVLWSSDERNVFFFLNNEKFVGVIAGSLSQLQCSNVRFYF